MGWGQAGLLVGPTELGVQLLGHLVGERREFVNADPEGLEVLAREDIALVIADQVMPGMTGVEFLERAIEIDPTAIRMMLTGYADTASLARAINEGRIYRYIAKPWEPDEVRLNVKRALESHRLASENAQLAAALQAANQRLRDENLYLRREVEQRYAFERIIGESPAMMAVFEVMEKVASTDATIRLSSRNQSCTRRLSQGTTTRLPSSLVVRRRAWAISASRLSSSSTR